MATDRTLTSNELLVRETAAALAHRACCGTEHDTANGKLHGYCVVCGVPWPCDTAKYYLRPAPETPDVEYRCTCGEIKLWYYTTRIETATSVHYPDRPCHQREANELKANETPQVRCTHFSGKHTMAINAEGKSYCTWCKWPSQNGNPQA